ncbi:MAG: hypothetical protein MUO67_03425, partial [Anaerolineales bacterium]|nr:hypothetical protein [Anaerolineales bacterium]
MSGFSCQKMLGFAALAVITFLSACSSSTPQPSYVDTMPPSTTTADTSPTPAQPTAASMPTSSPTSPPFTPTPAAQTPTLELTPSTSTLFLAEIPGWIAYTAILDPGPSVRVDIARLTADGGDHA